MTQNMKTIWVNRGLNVVAFCGVLVSALMAAASEIAGIADELTKAGVMPAKWAGAAAIIAVLGHVAAKFSKTPSAAIAAAVPPAQIAKGVPVPVPAWKDPPTGPAAILVILALSGLASCGDPAASVGAPASAPAYCPNTQDAYAAAQGLPLPYPNGDPNASFPTPEFFHPCLNAAGSPTALMGVPCYVCADRYDQDAVVSRNPPDQPCTQDTARVTLSTPPPVPFVVCVLPAVFRQSDTCDPGRWGCQ